MGEFNDYLSKHTINLFNAYFHKKKSLATRNAYLIEINLFAEEVKKDILTITKEDCKNYLTLLQSKVSDGVITSSTYSKKYKYLFAFFKYLEADASPPTSHFVNQLAYIPVKEPSLDINAERILPPHEFNGFMAYIRGVSYRDYLIGLITYFAGLRISELEAMKKTQLVKTDEGYALSLLRYKEVVLLKIPEEVVFALFDFFQAVNPESPYMFSIGKSMPVGSAAIHKNFRKYCRAYFGEDVSYTLSDIRHSGAFYAYMNSPTMDTLEDIRKTLGIDQKRYLERYEKLLKVVNKEVFSYCDHITVCGYFNNDVCEIED